MHFLDHWEVLLQFDVAALSGSTGNAGAEWDGTSFYSTRWASNLIHEYNATGTTLVREFSITGVSELRDLAWDGNYMYGGAAANTIYQMDFASETLIGTIPTTEPVRHISYDSDNDAFWVGNWSSDILLIDRTGNELARIPADPIVTSNYGSCYDNISPSGPFLWIFSQGLGAGAPQYLHQLQLPGGAATGVVHDVMIDVGLNNPGAVAGGLFCMTDYVPGWFTIGGLLWGGSSGIDQIFVYDVYGVVSVDDEMPVVSSFQLLQNYPNPFNPSTNIKYQIPEISFVTLKVYDVLGNEVATIVNEGKPPGEYEVEFGRDFLTSGIYLYRLKAGNFSATKKMILIK